MAVVTMYTAMVFTLVVVVTEVAAQQSNVTMRWNQFCDDSLVACSETYRLNRKNKYTTNAYYDCVSKVFCERWSEGYYKRQDILGMITAMLEYYDPQASNWKNGSCSQNISLSILATSIFALFKALCYLSRW